MSDDELKKIAFANRQVDYEIDPIFINRWSPRAMSGESIKDDELMPMFEAARWAASSFNHQPWRYIYAHRETPEFVNMTNLLTEPNKVWCKNAAVLIVAITQKNFEYNGQLNSTASFSSGSAFGNFALEGSQRGLVVHAMAGFDFDQARIILNIPDDYTVEAMVAVGKFANKETLPTDLQKIESPSGRKKVSELIFKGKFNEK